MAVTRSQMLPLGTEAPEFSLPDANGNVHSLADAAGADAFLVMFICNHCPFVRLVRREFPSIGDDYMGRNVAIFAINSNDFEAYPDDSPARMLEESKLLDYQFPYLVDRDQDVAKAYGAACTPDFFVFDRDRRLVYHGQLDGSRPSNGIPVTGEDLRNALDAALEREPVPEGQVPSIGCNIKWRPGNAPDYAG